MHTGGKVSCTIGYVVQKKPDGNQWLLSVLRKFYPDRD